MRTGTNARVLVRHALWLLCALAVLIAVPGGTAVASSTATDITGTWHCCSGGGAATQDFVISDGKGAIAGKGVLPGGTVFATITGSVSGTSVTIVTTYNSFSPGYVATFVGTLSADGHTIKGTWSSNKGQSGTFVATGGAAGEKITGKVQETSCGASSCTQKGLGGVRVTAAGSGGGSATTGADGTYSIDVDPGTYTVTPSLGGRDFDPDKKTVTVQKGGSGSASFTTCAPARQTSSAGSGRHTAATTCGLAVKISAQGSIKAGKSFRGADKAVPVSFVQPSATGNYKWWCYSGCVNLRINIRDPKTKLAPKSALVVVTAKVNGEPVTTGAPNGVFCRAVDAYLQKPCGINSSTELSNDGDLDLYYWVPGVIEPTTATLVVTVRSPKYPRVLKEVKVTIQPNVAFSKAIELVRRTADPLLLYGSLTRGVAIGDFLSYCDKLLTALSDKSGVGLSSGEKAAVLWAADFAKKFKGACGKIPSPSLLSKLAPVGPWKLWTTFRPEFGFPPNGILGASRLSDRAFQVVFNYSGFFEAFTKGLTEVVYHNLDLANPDATTPSVGTRIQLKVWEVSHRLPNGKVKDALYLKLTAGRGAKAYTATQTLVEGGYWPGCWLNPKLSSAEFTLVTNVCTNKYDDEYIK